MSENGDETMILKSRARLQSNAMHVSKSLDHSYIAFISNHIQISSSLIISCRFHQSSHSLSILFKKSSAFHSDFIMSSAFGILSQNAPVSHKDISNTYTQKTNTIDRTHLVHRSLLIYQYSVLPHPQVPQFRSRSQLGLFQLVTAKDNDSAQGNQSLVIAATTSSGFLAIVVLLLLFLLKCHHRDQGTEDPMAYETEGKIADLTEEAAEEEWVIDEIERNIAIESENRSFRTEGGLTRDELEFVSAYDEVF
jgi:hypothetical protein